MEPTPAGPPEFQVAFGGPRPQSRLTVAFRVILLVPHFFFAVVVGIVVYVVEIAGWFCALVLGRLPQGIHNFLTGAVRYFLRLNAYIYLLTDAYPPFSFRPEPYPAEVIVIQGRLNRLAVFFRFVLVIPAYLVLALVSSGISVFLFFTWLIVLVGGRMPASLHQALAAVVRYQTRFYAYFGMVTSTYPWGLFGDDPGQTAAPDNMPDQQDWEPRAEMSNVEATPAPPPPTYMLAGPTGEPLATRLVLTKAAKRIVASMLIVGALTYAGEIALSVALGANDQQLQAESDLSDAYVQLSDAFSQFQSDTSKCSSPADLPCVQPADKQLSAAFADFAQSVDALSVPSSDRADVNRLSAEATTVANDLDQMSTAPSVTEYQAAASKFQSEANRFDTDYQSLVNDLVNG